MSVDRGPGRSERGGRGLRGGGGTAQLAAVRLGRSADFAPGAGEPGLGLGGWAGFWGLDGMGVPVWPEGCGLCGSGKPGRARGSGGESPRIRASQGLRLPSFWP